MSASSVLLCLLKGGGGGEGGMLNCRSERVNPESVLLVDMSRRDVS